METFSISGNLVDVHQQHIYPAEITVENNIIKSIERLQDRTFDNYIMPGFIDSHIHIESSMLVPSEFARLAVSHGTIATVSDPHEIANVLGKKGVEFMLGNGAKVPFKFYFGVPSCVPATTFETAGAEISAKDTEELFLEYDLKYLSEMMNFPGVLYDFTDVAEKLEIARRLGKPIDGHAPGLRGKDVEKYVSAGISTDHESLSLEEAEEKIGLGMKILIREGSAVKDFEMLCTLIETNPDMCMLCSDDKHPDDLVQSHINELVKRALAKGFDLFKVLRTACVNPVLHYKLDSGLLREGDCADFIVVDNLNELNVLRTYINGSLVAENGKSLFGSVHVEPVNKFEVKHKQISDFFVPAKGGKIRVVEALEGLLITNEIYAEEKSVDGNLVSDIEKDILIFTVVNRYSDSVPAVGFIKNFGLKQGAIATSVAHDSHNIIAVGTSDAELCSAVNKIIETKGGMAVVNGDNSLVLPLPVAGLMSTGDGFTVAEQYSLLNKITKELGTKLRAPFMTLSFMALLVIPKIKLSDKGLFDGTKFEFIDLQV
ncbi:MAG: adenine deaminase [Bacteroidota bacterium]